MRHKGRVRRCHRLRPVTGLGPESRWKNVRTERPMRAKLQMGNIFVYVLRTGERPMDHPAPRVIWSR